MPFGDSPGGRCADLALVSSAGPRSACGLQDRKARAMAHKTVQLLIGQILTDEELRGKFLDRPLETLTALRDAGVDLTKNEIDALLVTDPGFWGAGARRIDSRLQRCRLRGFNDPKRH
jgi:hypothetical protein